jgi:hypothetical protein
MAMSQSTSPNPFEPGVCHVCGRILDDKSNGIIPVNGTDVAAPVSSSDPCICLHCESILSTGSVQALQQNDLAAFLDTLETQGALASLVIIDSRREVQLPGISLVCLGRRDEERNIYPHIDLSYDGAASSGVSRRHACIHQSDQGIFIEDLGSTNGTFLNGQQLIPSQLYPLDHGDMVHLGQLKLAITVCREPATAQDAASKGYVNADLQPDFSSNTFRS